MATNLAITRKPVKIRQVYADNLVEEFELIEYNLRCYPYLSIDNEFPGTVFQSKKPYYELSPPENYMLMRENVNRMKLIQLGLTLTDAKGNLPDLGSSHCYIWEFNFREFDEKEDLCNPDSINLLKNQGIDLLKNQIEGVDASQFAKLFMASGLGFSFRSFLDRKKESDPRKLTWIFFHATYDVGYLIKLLTQQELPVSHVTFMALVEIYLGTSIFDVKEMIKPYGWKVGLEKLSEYLGVERIAGQSHQAGSDSLLTMQIFMRLKDNHFNGENQMSMYTMFNRKLYGLEVNHSLVIQQLMLARKDLTRRNVRDQPVVYYPRGRGNRAVMMCHPNINYLPVVAVQPVCSYFNRL